MLSCKETAELVSRRLDAGLPLGTRLKVRIHLLLCVYCRHYEAQLKFLRELLRRRETLEAARDGAPGLSPEARARIAATVRQALAATPNPE
jgi:hypothetical protein